MCTAPRSSRPAAAATSVELRGERTSTASAPMRTGAMVILMTVASQAMFDGMPSQRRHAQRPVGRLRRKEVTNVTQDDDAAHCPHAPQACRLLVHDRTAHQVAANLSQWNARATS